MQTVSRFSLKRTISIYFRIQSFGLHSPVLVWYQHVKINKLRDIAEWVESSVSRQSRMRWEDAIFQFNVSLTMFPKAIILMNERDSRLRRRSWWSSLFERSKLSFDDSSSRTMITYTMIMVRPPVVVYRKNDKIRSFTISQSAQRSFVIISFAGLNRWRIRCQWQ